MTKPAAVPIEVQLIVDALDNKRAKNVVVMDLTGVSESLDYFILAVAESSLQLKAFEESIKEKLKENGSRPRGVEGPSDRWLLLDYGEVVSHLMSYEAREFYDLEGLWADAKRVNVIPN